MGIFGGIARIFGRVEAKVDKDKKTVIVTGIPAKTITVLMAKWLRTNRIDQFMFITLKTNYFAFYEFYALEIRNILSAILLQKDTTYKQRRVINKIIAELEEKTWLQNETAKDIKPMIDLSLLSRLKWVPKPHQLEALKAFGDTVPRYGLKGYYIAAQPGTGKTFYDIALATILIPQSLAEVKIVISPKNAIENVWARTIKDCFKKPPKDWISNVKGAPPLGREYYVFHYEALDRAVDLCDTLTKKHINYFVIIDEAHNFNSINSGRTKRLIDICKNAKGPYSIWASGSPIKALGSEVIPILKCIDPLFTDLVEPGFKKIFGGVNKRANEIVHKRFGLVSHKIPSSVVGEIPQPKPIRVMVKIPNPAPFLIDNVKEEVRAYVKERVKYYKANLDTYKEKFNECLEYHRHMLSTVEERERFSAYEKDLKIVRKHADSIRGFMDVLGRLNKYEKDYLLPSLTPELKNQFNEVKTVIKALALKVSGEAVGQIYTKRKAECSAALAKYANLNEIIDSGLAKTLIFSNWTEPLQKAEEGLIKLGYKPAHVYGKDTKFTGKIVDAFHDDPDINPLLATYQALSTAVPVTAANQVVLLDYPYREYIYSQSIARAARIGQQHPVFVYELALDTGDIPNVSTRGIDICEFSREQVSEILGEEFGGFTADDYQVKHAIAEGAFDLPLEMDPNTKAEPKTALSVLCKALGLKRK